MTDFDYQTLASRTCPAGHQHRTDLVPAEHFRIRLEEARDATVALDSFKKALAYGKPTVFGDVHPPLEVTNTKILLLTHMILGIVTEAGELLEALIPVLFDGATLDEVNMQEEMGDVAWYRANALIALGQTIRENDQQNIDKLFRRFPDKFDADLAINRDTVAERKVLEGNSDDHAEELGDVEIVPYGPDHDRLRYADDEGDLRFTGRLVLQPFVAGDEYDGKYKGQTLATDATTLYRITGKITDSRGIEPKPHVDPGNGISRV